MTKMKTAFFDLALLCRLVMTILEATVTAERSFFSKQRTYDQK